jgi:hypothetical protein
VGLKIKAFLDSSYELRAMNQDALFQHPLQAARLMSRGLTV